MKTQHDLISLVLQTVAFFSHDTPSGNSLMMQYERPDVHNTEDRGHWWNQAKYSWIWYNRSGPVVNMWLIKVKLRSSLLKLQLLKKVNIKSSLLFDFTSRIIVASLSLGLSGAARWVGVEGKILWCSQRLDGEITKTWSFKNTPLNRSTSCW